MKILFVGSGFLPEKVGAMELHMQFAAKELIKQGHDVLVVCRGYSPGREEYSVESTEFDGIPVKRLNHKFSRTDSFEMMYSNPDIVRTFEGIFREYEPDVVHIHHLFALTLDIVDYVKVTGVPLVMTLHDYWLGCPRRQRITSSLEACPEVVLDRCVNCLRSLWPAFFSARDENLPKKQADSEDRQRLEKYHEKVKSILDKVDQLIAPSRFVQTIYARYGIAKRAISIVPSGMDMSRFEVVRRKRSSIFRFGYLGPVIPSKGVHILIEAFQTIAGSDCALEIWGEVLPFYKDTNYGHRLAILAKGWETSIQFKSRYDNADVAGILSAIDALVVPSLWYEAYPMTIQEAFLAGTPVIVSNFGGLSEAVEDEETGLLFNVGDSVDLAKKMKRIKQNATLRQKLTESPKSVRTVEETVATLLEIYSSLRGDRDDE